ncbi:hypothetical protein RclHR1_00850018 [Rhizophagus clarus]|uniref:Uncharacterized protein n=1 Tax=Rhizophagus clarus TaxID=94130 RepID=A0A2Z6SN89_9GLOM|nr:hypothetical protein RclHR1_00850018 [Rhizophagus clarus]GES98098.1 hypothetical protein GLOIN_2v1880782 [Rhizophagus clarus]
MNTNSHIHGSNLQAHNTQPPVTYDNNVNQPNVNHNHNHQQQQHDDASCHNYQHQQYIQQPDTSNYHSYQVPIPSVSSNNNSSDNNHHVSNNIPHYSDQQLTCNNISSPQFQNQHNLLPLLNPLGISIYYSQAPIIIMPTTNSDIQNQLQQVLASLISKINP